MTALAEVAAPANLVDELTAHAVASINAADHSPSPFPHIVFRDFFPGDFYRDLIRSVPTQGYYPITGTGTRMALRRERRQDRAVAAAGLGGGVGDADLEAGRGRDPGAAA